MSDDLTPGGRINRMSSDADELATDINDLDASVETKRAIAKACAAFREADLLLQIDRGGDNE